MWSRPQGTRWRNPKPSADDVSGSYDHRRVVQHELAERVLEILIVGRPSTGNSPANTHRLTVLKPGRWRPGMAESHTVIVSPDAA